MQMLSAPASFPGDVQSGKELQRRPESMGCVASGEYERSVARLECFMGCCVSEFTTGMLTERHAQEPVRRERRAT